MSVESKIRYSMMQTDRCYDYAQKAIEMCETLQKMVERLNEENKLLREMLNERKG